MLVEFEQWAGLVGRGYLRGGGHVHRVRHRDRAAARTPRRCWPGWRWSEVAVPGVDRELVAPPGRGQSCALILVVGWAGAAVCAGGGDGAGGGGGADRLRGRPGA